MSSGLTESLHEKALTELRDLYQGAKLRGDRWKKQCLVNVEEREQLKIQLADPSWKEQAVSATDDRDQLQTKISAIHSAIDGEGDWTPEGVAAVERIKVLWGSRNRLLCTLNAVQERCNGHERARAEIAKAFGKEPEFLCLADVAKSYVDQVEMQAETLAQRDALLIKIDNATMCNPLSSWVPSGDATLERITNLWRSHTLLMQESKRLEGNVAVVDRLRDTLASINHAIDNPPPAEVGNQVSDWRPSGKTPAEKIASILRSRNFQQNRAKVNADDLAECKERRAELAAELDEIDSALHPSLEDFPIVAATSSVGKIRQLWCERGRLKAEIRDLKEKNGRQGDNVISLKGKIVQLEGGREQCALTHRRHRDLISGIHEALGGGSDTGQSLVEAIRSLQAERTAAQDSLIWEGSVVSEICRITEYVGSVVDLPTAVQSIRDQRNEAQEALSNNESFISHIHSICRVSSDIDLIGEIRGRIERSDRFRDQRNEAQEALARAEAHIMSIRRILGVGSDTDVLAVVTHLRDGNVALQTKIKGLQEAVAQSTDTSLYGAYVLSLADKMDDDIMGAALRREQEKNQEALKTIAALRDEVEVSYRTGQIVETIFGYPIDEAKARLLYPPTIRPCFCSELDEDHQPCDACELRYTLKGAVSTLKILMCAVKVADVPANGPEPAGLSTLIEFLEMYGKDETKDAG